MEQKSILKKLRLSKKDIFLACLSVFVTFLTISIWIYQLNSTPVPTQAAAATCYWVGDTNPANWNDASHWSSAEGGAGSTCDGGVVPGSDDTVIFSAANTNEATFDATTTVAAFQMSAGKVSMGNTLYTLTTGSLEITGGEFSIIDQGSIRTKVTTTSFSLSNGTFNLGNWGKLYVNGALTISSGTMTAGGSNSVTYVSGNIDMSGNAGTYTGQLNLNGSSSTFKPQAGSSRTITIDKTVGQTLTMTGDLNTTGSIYLNSGNIDPGTYRVTMNGDNMYLNLNGQSLYDVTINCSNTRIQDSDGIITHNLTVNNGKEFIVYLNRTLTIASTATTTLTGTGILRTWNFSGRITFVDNAVANISTTGTLSGVIRLQASTGDIILPARTYTGKVEVYNGGADNRVATLGTAAGQTITFGNRFFLVDSAYDGLYLYADGNGNITVDGSTYNPTVTFGRELTESDGNIDFVGSGAGSEILNAGNGTWTVEGNIDFTGGNFDPGSSTFLINHGNGKIQTITSAGQHFNNITEASPHANGLTTLRPVDAIYLEGNLYLDASGGITTDDVTFDAATNNPAVTIVGSIDYSGTGLGDELINMGTNTWTVGGNIDLTAGTIDDGSSTLVLNGSGNQSITSASQQFNNLQITNASASPGVTFVDSSNVAGTATITTASVTATFTAGTTHTWNTINFNGQAVGTRVVLRSTAASAWNFNVTTNSGVSYVNASYSNASGGIEINASNGTNVNGGNNTNWYFGVTISGTFYTQEDKLTNIGAGHNIGVSVNGGTKITATSGAGGTFSFLIGDSTNQPIAIFIDNDATYEGTLITVAADGVTNIIGLEGYTNKVVLRHENAGPISNALLIAADTLGDDDVHYSNPSGSIITFDAGYETWIEASKTYTPGAAVNLDSVDINGAFTMEANAISVTGNWDAAGGSFSATGTATMAGTDAQTITSDGDSFNNLTIKNTNASGAIIADALSVGGNLSLSADGASNVTLDASTNNPDVSITGNLDYVGVGAGTEILNMGNGTWTINGGADFVDGTTNTNLSTIRMTGNGTTFYSGHLTNINNLRISANVEFRSVGGGGRIKSTGTLTIDNGVIFTLAAGEIQNQGGTTTINGTLAGSITYDMLNQAAANLSTTGTITAPVRFYANSMNITVPSRSFDNTVEVWTNTGTRSVTYGTAGGQTISFNSNLIVRNSDNGIFTNNFSTYNPTVNVGGDLTFTNNGGGTLPLTMGDGTWTIGGNANFSNITSFDANSSTLVMSGNSKALTTDSRTFNNFTVENLTGSAQTIVISGTLNLNGNLNINAAGAGEANLDCATNNPAVNIAGNIDFTGVGAGSEDIHMGTNTWTVGGNIDLTGGTITAGSSTLLLNASDTGNTITSASQHFNNAQFNNASGGWSFSDAANIDGNLTVTTSETVGNGINFNNQAIDIAGNLQIDGGKLTMGNSTINLAGNWTRNGGTVVPNTSELILDSSSAQSVLSGGQSFSDLTLANTNIANGVTFTDGATATGTFTNSTQDSKTTFHAGSTYAFNAINIAGAAGHLVNFVSSAPGTAWLLNVADASPTADYVSTTDSDASLSSQINATTGGFNGGGNTNWLFAPATVTVAPASVTLDSGVDQAFAATAADAQGYNIPSATFSWAAVAGGGTITPLGVFTAGSTAGTFNNTVRATYSGASGYATVIINGSPIPPTPPTPSTPEPGPSGDACALGNITQVSIQDRNFSLEPGGLKTLGITFMDANGTPIDKSSVVNFKMTPDHGSSYWNISSGGGRLADENLDTININFVGGGTRGSFGNSIIFSACGGQLKAYASPTIVKQKQIFADIEPSTYALQTGESFNFSASLFDDIQNPIDETCSYSWTLSDPNGAKIESPASTSTKITGSTSGEYTVKVDVTCPSGTASTSASLAVVKIDEKTEWQLESYFPSLTSWEGQKTYVGFIPRIKVGTRWYSRAEQLDYIMADPSAAKVTGLHPNYPNIPIIEATKAGCFPFQVQATLNKFGKSYFASTNMNIGSADKSSYYNQFQPTLGSSTLSYQHIVKSADESRLNLNRGDAGGQSYSNYNWIYVGKPMTTSWIVNDTRIGNFRPYYNASYLNTSDASYGYYPKALTTVVDFNGSKKTENWDIWIEKSNDKITFSSSIPDTITVKPNSYFRGVWQGYKYVNWNEFINYPYNIKSLNADAVSLVSNGEYAMLFKSGSKEGTYPDAIVVGTPYSSGRIDGGTERKIKVIIDNNATADLCSASAFAQISNQDNSVGPGESAGNKEAENNKGVTDKLIDLWNTITAAVETALSWLNSHPIASAVIGLLASLPALLSIISTSIAGNALGSFSKIFSALSVGVISGKKNRRLGYVYDWQSKKPIKGARVSAYDTFTKKLSYQTVTNYQGEFILLLPEGEYYLTVEKKGFKPYESISIESKERFTGSRTDGYYEAIYLPSETLNITKGQGDFAHSIAIPLQSPSIKSNALLHFIIRLAGWFIKLSFIFLIAGSIMTIGLVIYDRSNWVNIIILLYYIFVWILYLYRHFTFFSGTAKVVDQNGNAVDLALIRVFNKQNKLVQTVVSDRKGSFVLNLARGRYGLQVRKAGYAVKEMDLRVNTLSDVNTLKVKI